jgi:hypothetical protein
MPFALVPKSEKDCGKGRVEKSGGLRLNWMCLGGHGEIQSSALAQLSVVIVTHFASNVQRIWRICGCRVSEEFLPVLDAEA